VHNISHLAEGVSFNLMFKISSFDFNEDVPQEAEQPEVEIPVDDINEEAIQPDSGGDLGGELQSISEELESIDSGGTEPSIIFGNINFVSSDEPVYLDVSAANTGVAFLFRDLLEESSAFHAVEIISDIIDSANRVNFTIKFLIGS